MIVRSIEAEYRSYKKLAEGALAQVPEERLCEPGPGARNSLAVICWHVSGNLKSRFTDFLTTDGEKPWRRPDEEFEARTISRETLMAKWEEGWAVLLATLAGLSFAESRWIIVALSEYPARRDRGLQREKGIRELRRASLRFKELLEPPLSSRSARSSIASTASRPRARSHSGSGAAAGRVG